MQDILHTHAHTYNSSNTQSHIQSVCGVTFGSSPILKHVHWKIPVISNALQFFSTFVPTLQKLLKPPNIQRNVLKHPTLKKSKRTIQVYKYFGIYSKILGFLSWVVTRQTTKNCWLIDHAWLASETHLKLKLSHLVFCKGLDWDTWFINPFTQYKPKMDCV